MKFDNILRIRVSVLTIYRILKGISRTSRLGKRKQAGQLYNGIKLGKESRYGYDSSFHAHTLTTVAPSSNIF